jgi:hypothetical protein
MPQLEEIHANLGDRLKEAKEQGWLGKVAAIETTLAAAAQKRTPGTRFFSTRPHPTTSAITLGTRCDAPRRINDH